MREAVIAANLVRLRKIKELTQEELAEKAGLSRAGYRNFERGRATPQAETLRALAEALGVPQRELVVSVPTLTQVRFRSLKRLKRRDQVLYEVGRWLRDLNDLEKLLERSSDGDRFREVRRRVLDAAADPIRRAAAVRKAFGRDEREPIRDICGLLESEGVKVWSVNVASDAFFGLSVAEDDGPAIVVNTWDRFPVEHWIFSAAHELGHLLMHEGDYRVDYEDETDAREKEANVFASHFLMPDEVFRREWEETAGSALLGRVLKVKRMFRVSWRTVLYRVSERLSPDRKTTLWRRINVEHQQVFGRPLNKYDEPWPIGTEGYRDLAGGETAGMAEYDFRGDRLFRLVREAVEAERITRHRAAEILQISLRELNDLAASWAAGDVAGR